MGASQLGGRRLVRAGLAQRLDREPCLLESAGIKKLKGLCICQKVNSTPSRSEWYSWRRKFQ